MQMDLQKGEESKPARVEEYDSCPSFVYIYYMYGTKCIWVLRDC